jgi:hypothetical protein
MKHPSEAALALHAGDDLSAWARWRVNRHLNRCERCRDEVAAFHALREIVPDLSETPELGWGRLAAEMKANIRLGLAAGECVRNGDTPSTAPVSIFSTARAVVALASVVALMVTGLMLEHPAPHSQMARQQGIVLQSTADGIQVRDGARALRLMNRDAQDVTYTVGAQGSMRARYVDPETGYVTINNVYAE